MIDWPVSIARTPESKRISTKKFKATLGDTNELIRNEMRLMGSKEWRIETDSGGAHVHSDGLPKSTANPDDPSVVLRFIYENQQRAVGCDRFTQLSDNLRELAKWLKDTRMSNGRAVATAYTAYAQAALPAGNESPAVVLGVEPTATPSEIRERFREQAKDAHPDNEAGSTKQFKRLKNARDTMLHD